MFFNFSFFAKPSIDFVHLWHDDKTLSKLLCSTIPIPVHDLKIKVTDFDFFMPRHQKVAGYYVIPSEILSVRPSVRLSVCPSIRPSVRQRPPPFLYRQLLLQF